MHLSKGWPSVGGCDVQAAVHLSGVISELVCLVHLRLEVAFKAERVVLFTGISFLLSWDAATDGVRVSKIIVSCVVRTLEVIVDLSSLLLFSQCKVMALQLGREVKVIHLLRSAELSLALDSREVACSLCGEVAVYL